MRVKYVFAEKLNKVLRLPVSYATLERTGITVSLLLDASFKSFMSGKMTKSVK